MQGIVGERERGYLLSRAECAWHLEYLRLGSTYQDSKVPPAVNLLYCSE